MSVYQIFHQGAAQFVVVQQFAICFTVFIFKAVKIFLNTKNRVRKYISIWLVRNGEWGRECPLMRRKMVSNKYKLRETKRNSWIDTLPAYSYLIYDQFVDRNVWNDFFWKLFESSFQYYMCSVTRRLNKHQITGWFYRLLTNLKLK